MKPKDIPLEAGKYYHIYNRGNNHEKLFYKKENYEYFLRKYNYYLSGYLDTFAFCLLPNHFHLLVRVKEVNPPIKVPPFKKVEPFSPDRIISEQFRFFFTGYAMAINKQEERTGSLFQKNFKRIQVTNEAYIKNLIFYIHANPQLHGIINDFRKYKWSSYNSILSCNTEELIKKEVVEWFDDIQNFIDYHAMKSGNELNEDLIIE